jgi:hypothetical protein
MRDLFEQCLLVCDCIQSSYKFQEKEFLSRYTRRTVVYSIHRTVKYNTYGIPAQDRVCNTVYFLFLLLNCPQSPLGRGSLEVKNSIHDDVS